MTRREERSRDRATSGREEKPPRLRAAILSRETPEGSAIKLHAEERERLWRYFLSEVYFILVRITVRAGGEISRSLIHDDRSH